MSIEFQWGIWMKTGTPFKGQAHGCMNEDVFRRLLKGLVEVTGNTDRALDRIKDIMVCEINKVATK